MLASPDSALADRIDSANLLRQHRIMPTHQRLIIAQVLFACHQHLSAEQLLAKVKRRFTGISKATIYNTLHLFQQKRLVRTVVVDPERVFYDTNLLPHQHIFDQDSGMLLDMDSSGLRIEGIPALPAGMRLEGIDLVLRIRSSP